MRKPDLKFLADRRAILVVALCLVVSTIVVFSIRYIREHNTVYSCEDASAAIASGGGLDRFKVVDPYGTELNKSQIDGLQRYVIDPYLKGLKVKAVWRQPAVRNGFFMIEQEYCDGNLPVHALTVSCADAPGRPVVELYGILESLWTPMPSKTHQPELNALYMNAHTGIERDKAALIKAGLKYYGVSKGVPVSWDTAAAWILKEAQTQNKISFRLRN